MSEQKKETIKIGIVTCANATQDLDCCSVSCLRDFSKRLGTFSLYPQNAELRLMGLISCSGCPTLTYPEKIIKRVASLVRFGVTHIHFANCLTAFCPFAAKYRKVILEKYPALILVDGTHEQHISNDLFREKVCRAFEANKKMPDIILGDI